MALFEPIFEALNRAGCRYVVVGGVATVLHGFARLTADVDIVVDLEREAALKAVRALTRLGFRPRAPVNAESFADPKLRRSFIEDKGMRVFSLWDPATPLREVDLFVEHPIEFEALWTRSKLVELGQTSVRIASIPDLIQLKSLAGRPEDLQDIEALRRILARKTS